MKIARMDTTIVRWEARRDEFHDRVTKEVPAYDQIGLTPTEIDLLDAELEDGDEGALLLWGFPVEEIRG